MYYLNYILLKSCRKPKVEEEATKKINNCAFRASKKMLKKVREWGQNILSVYTHTPQKWEGLSRVSLILSLSIRIADQKKRFLLMCVYVTMIKAHECLFKDDKRLFLFFPPYATNNSRGYERRGIIRALAGCSSLRNLLECLHRLTPCVGNVVIVTPSTMACDHPKIFFVWIFPTLLAWWPGTVIAPALSGGLLAEQCPFFLNGEGNCSSPFVVRTWLLPLPLLLHGRKEEAAKKRSDNRRLVATDMKY